VEKAAKKALEGAAVKKAEKAPKGAQEVADKPDWKVALENQLKDQGAHPRPGIGRTATQKAEIEGQHVG
jgi:hypothetical protein